MIWFPVTCPRCGGETLDHLPLARVAEALVTKDKSLRLYAPCHEFYWPASPEELDQIGQYFLAWTNAAPESLVAAAATAQRGAS